MFFGRRFFLILRTVSNALILGAFFIFAFSFGPILKEEAFYQWRSFRGITFSLEEGLQPKKHSPFGFLLEGPAPLRVYPVSTAFGIVIEKIGVNAPVVADVNVASYTEYFEALKNGVAHARGSALPGQPGQTYLFAHSALDFWNFGKYAMVFTLLHKLEEGDRIALFYQGERYDYYTTGKEVFKSFDLTPMKRRYEEPVLTIQTCDPPGTALNRLIVTARLSRM